MKNLKDRLGQLRVGGRHKHEEDGDGGGGDSPSRAAATPPPATNLSRSASPGPPAPPGATPPRGAVMIKSGPLPPGAKIMKGPPPGDRPATFASHGSGATPANVSPVRPGATPPPGAKVMAGPPPAGAKIMSGPPPGAVKMTGGPLPPGAKKMVGGPPPGSNVAPAPSQPRPVSPPGRSFMSGSAAVKLPPGAKIMSGPPPGAKIINGPPPSAKIMHGAPPPGARIIKAPASRPLTPETSVSKSPVFHVAGSSRPTTPEQPSAFGGKSVPSPPSLAGMKKIIHGPPPPGAKIMMKAPGGSPPLRTVSPPAAPASPPHGLVAGKAPAKMQMKLSPRRPSGPPTPITSQPSTPQLIPQNASFSHPPASPVGKTRMIRPQPVRTNNLPDPRAVPKPLSPALFAEAAGGKQQAVSGTRSSSSLNVPTPLSEEEVEFQLDDEDGNGEEDIQFDDASGLDIREDTSPVTLNKTSRANKEENSINFHAGASTNSSNMFREEADLQTALPPPGGTCNKSPSMASVQSSSIAMKSASTTQAVERAPPPAPKSPRQATQRDTNGADDERGKEKRRRRKHRSAQTHRKHHRRAKGRDPSASSSSASSSTSSAPSSAASSRRRRTYSKARRDTNRTSRTPATVERTGKKKERSDDSVKQENEEGRGSSSFVPQFSEKAMSTAALTSSLRSRIADQFLSILCPQQYYGKVKKINGIRPLNADRRQATALRNHNCIYVATKGVIPNQFFYPQLRLYESDGRPTVDDKDRGTLDTPIILYEAAPGNMLFAETELEAQRVLESNRDANSCFVLSSSAILFKDPEHFVLPLAMLNVRWTPYASPQSEPQCPIHHKELQLFDPYTKELVCALCASKDSAHLSKLVVIPDVLQGDSRRKIHESLARQLDEAQHSAKMWVGQHQRIHQLCANKKEAIQQQFDLLAAAVDAKRKEFMEACEAEYGLAQGDVAREILVADERVQLLSAAAEHLRTDATRPLYSMQIATIAEGLEATKQLPSSFSKRSLHLPAVPNTVMPNLENVMTELQTLSPMQEGGVRLGRAYTPSKISNSPFQPRHQRTWVADHVTIHSNNQSPYRSTPRSLSAGAVRGSVSPRSRRTLNGGADDDNDGNDGNVPQRSVSAGGVRRSYRAQQQARVRSTTSRGSVRTPQPSPRRAPPPPFSPGDGVGQPRRKMSRSSAAAQHDDDGDEFDADGPSPYRTDTVTVPNSTGTSLFDYPLDELLRADEEESSSGPAPPRLRKPPTVQWTMRVEDPGDWVGIGVGVGTTIDVWERGRSNDLSHLWIVPGGGGGGRAAPSERQVYRLRVTVNPTVGHARLSIHDARGRQLDDGSIPQWNASRVSYPQVTFGGRIGQVRMIEAPHIVT